LIVAQESAALKFRFFRCFLLGIRLHAGPIKLKAMSEEILYDIAANEGRRVQKCVRLAGCKAPKKIRTVSVLPGNVMGKIVRRKIAALFDPLENREEHRGKT
jgi:hypothetical protein